LTGLFGPGCQGAGDPWANGWVSNNSGLITNSFTPTASTNFDGANHLLTGGASYLDPSNILTGNQTVIGGYTLTYDAENRVSSSAIGGHTTTYVYDGNGHRVMKSTGTAATTYVYDAMNQLIAEYGTPSAVDTGTKYVSVDHLGSTRLVTDTSSPTPNQEICYDFLPFGELIPSGTDGRSGCYGSTATPLTQKFTGKERDAESGLDWFSGSVDQNNYDGTQFLGSAFASGRYFSSAQGRFTSPDMPLLDQDPSNPQSWNLYGYVRNNPLSNIDPTGRRGVTTTVDGKDSVGDNGDGQGCDAAKVAPTQNNQTPSDTNASDVAPQQVSTTAQSEPFSLTALYSGAKEFVRSSPFPITLSFGVGTPQTGNSIGPQINLAIIPKTRQVCLSVGLYVTTPGSAFVNASIGLLVHGPLDQAADVVSSFGVGGTLQKSVGVGYQVSSSSSGTLGGPSVGTLGVSASAGYGRCFTVGN